MQWSPTEPYVFASCSVDGNIAIWDIRLGKSPAASIKAHNVDVNVISWNRYLNVFSFSRHLCLIYVFDDLSFSFLPSILVYVIPSAFTILMQSFVSTRMQL